MARPATTQQAILRALVDRYNPASGAGVPNGELAQLLGLSRSNVAKTLCLLSRQGHVERWPASVTGHYRATDAGKARIAPVELLKPSWEQDTPQNRRKGDRRQTRLQVKHERRRKIRRRPEHEVTIGRVTGTLVEHGM